MRFVARRILNIAAPVVRKKLAGSEPLDLVKVNIRS